MSTWIYTPQTAVYLRGYHLSIGMITLEGCLMTFTKAVAQPIQESVAKAWPVVGPGMSWNLDRNSEWIELVWNVLNAGFLQIFLNFCGFCRWFPKIISGPRSVGAKDPDSFLANGADPISNSLGLSQTMGNHGKPVVCCHRFFLEAQKIEGLLISPAI